MGDQVRAGNAVTMASSREARRARVSRLRVTARVLLVSTVVGSGLPILAAVLPGSVPGLAPTAASAVAPPPKVSAWGSNTVGQVGDSTSGNVRTSPVAVQGMADIAGFASAIDAGGTHSLAVTTSGGVRAWGSDSNGQLGNGGTNANSSIPITVAGLSGAASVSGGALHSLAVTSGGQVWAWGYNFYGQVGDNTTTERAAPVQVITSGATQVSAGSDHSLALVGAAVWAWGSNSNGQTGSPTSGPPGPSLPTATGLTGFKAVAAGAFHSLALRNDGTVFSWGRNNSGQLGRNCPFGTCIDTYEAAAVPGVTNAVAVAAGASYSMALLSNGTVMAWGANSSGQLGDGTTTQRKAAVAVKNSAGTGSLGAIRSVAAGSSHSLASTDTGKVFAWGSNGSGELGDTTTTARLLPVAVAGTTGVSQVTAGFGHSVVNNAMPIGGAVTGAQSRGPGSRASQNDRCGRIDTAKPITTSTGNFWHSFADLAVAGRGPGLAFGRTYNTSAAAIDGLFGFGWASSYAMKVVTSSTGAVITEEDGNEVAFDLAGGIYSPVAPRMSATLASVAGGFTYTRRNRDIFGFDTSGRLTSISDRNGYSTTIGYPSSVLMTVTDSAGRVINLTRNGAGRITNLTETYAPGRSLTFNYDGAGNLSEVIDVNGGRATFGYDASHRMTTMREPKYFGDTTTIPTPVVTNVYDASNRVISQTDAVGRTTTFDYAPPGEPLGSTLITDPKANKTLDTYAFGLLVAHTTGYGTAQASTWTKR